jgi:hypothetical protein
MKTITITDSMSDTEIARLARSSDFNLDISRLSDLSRLPAHVLAILHTEANTLTTPNLQTAATIHAPNATEVNLPQLKKARVIYANAAASFSAPQLRAFSHIFAFRATSLHIPLSGVSFAQRLLVN